MGYALSKYDDVRLKDNPVGIESRRESFILTYSKSSRDGIEFDVADLEKLTHALDVLRAYVFDKPSLCKPSPGVAALWRQEAEDTELLESFDEYDTEDLRRVLALREREEVR